MFKGNGARTFAKRFYSSGLWTKKSIAYRNAHPFCERCLEKGIYKRADLVHHKVHIDESNYRTPEILIKDENLESLCEQCHYEEHNEKESHRFNRDGSLIL